MSDVGKGRRAEGRCRRSVVSLQPIRAYAPVGGQDSKVGMKANAGIYLSACTSFRSILLFTAAAYLIILLRLGKGLPDSILATTDCVVPIRSAICFCGRQGDVLQ